MNLEGIASNYKVDRSLSEQEKKARLSLKSFGTRLEPTSQGCMVRLNSIFMESVDKFYPNRGVLLLFVGPLLLLGLQATVSAPIIMATKHWAETAGTERIGALGFTSAWVSIALAFTVLMLRIVAKDALSYTHFPIRLNRKNRTVYVFRSNKPNGVLQVKWDEVYWVLATSSTKFAGSHDFEIRGHVMDADGITVRDTFSLGESNVHRDIVERQWEHYRRYMEGGPGQIGPQELLPLHGGREGFWFGMKRAGAIFSAHWLFWVVASPAWATLGVARWICMFTSRQPRWPADVEAACAVPPGDEPRNKDAPAKIGDVLAWVSLVVTSTFGASIGGYGLYLLFTASGFTRNVSRTLQMLW